MTAPTADGDREHQLLQRIAALEADNAKLLETNAHLAQLADKFRRMVFSRRSEWHVDDQHPLLPFPGDEPPPPPPPHVDEGPTKSTRRRSRSSRVAVASVGSGPICRVFAR